MKVPVQVLNSRAYSFNGKDGKPVHIVEASCLVKVGDNQVAGKINMRGESALNPGSYIASLRVSEQEGKLKFTLGDFVPAVASASSYSAAAGK